MYIHICVCVCVCIYIYIYACIYMRVSGWVNFNSNSEVHPRLGLGSNTPVVKSSDGGSG